MKMLFLGVVTALTVTTAAAQGTKSANDVLSYCKLAPKAAATTEVGAREFGYAREQLTALWWARGADLI